MTDGIKVGRGRLWGEALGIAVIFFLASIVAGIIGGLGYVLFFVDAGATPEQLADPELGARIAFLTLPLATIITLAATFYMLKSRGVNWRDLGLRKPDKILITILFGFGIFVVATIFSALTNAGMEALGYKQDLSIFNFLQGDFAMYLYLITVISWFSAGFAEEYFFRGFIMGNIALALGNTQKAWVLAAVVQALIFGLFHLYQGLNGFVSVTVIALVFGFFYFKLRSLWPVIIAHGIMDVFGITILYFGLDIPA